MKRAPADKILDFENIGTRVREIAGDSGTIVFTNGCFGLLHPGHSQLLHEASKLGTTLVVAVNSDASYREVKRREPPISWYGRAYMLASLECVDVVLEMSDLTPHKLLSMIRPDFLVKSNTSWLPPVGHEVVESYGGQVVVIEPTLAYSTTGLLAALSVYEAQESRL